MHVSFRTEPSRYRHWRYEVDGEVAVVTMDVDEEGGLVDGYELKLNSYDLGVDIELYDLVQRLRFEHPEVRAVVMTGGKDRVFCAGANIKMLASSSHPWKVNFCKFTNETRNGIEDATTGSGQTWIAAINGTCAGGGYELALACDHLILADDNSSTVALPEVPLLAVLPGTGGLTRVTDKRHVRRDHADVFSTLQEGMRGDRAVEWRLVDELAPPTELLEHATRVARERAATSDRPADVQGIALTPLQREEDGDTIRYPNLTDRPRPGRAHGHVRRPRPDHRAAVDAARPSTRPATSGGRSPCAASSTTRSWTCAPTSSSSAPGCSARPGTPTRCWPWTR